MPSLSMVFDLLAIDRASAVFDRVGGSAAAAGREVDAASGSMAAAGSKIAAGVGIAGAAIAVVSAKMAGDFQQNITKLNTTAGESQANLKMVGDGILSMAGQVGIGAIELSKGMYTVESSGIHGADALNVLKAAAQGAKQEQADLGKVTDAVTTALHDYSLPASAAADVTSQMVAAVSTGKTTFDELTGSLHSVTPMAAALHIPFSDIIGSLAAMTASGMSADQATQDMAQSLRSLQSPTKPMIDELAQLGITASDLGAQLGTKGLSGTIQEISGAILQHMGPSGQVLLGTFNQSKVAAQDAAIMYDNLPPKLRAMADSYKNGTLSVADMRAEVKKLPADQQTLWNSWRTGTDGANGFTQALKSGKPDAQEFTAALAKAMGTAPGLAVALQLTGDHAAVVNQNIKNIAASTGDASGNIKGWTEVQGNFNQQLAQAGASLESMAIQFGQKLLPALTTGFGFINSTVLPGLQHLGSFAGDAAHWFAELPGPVKEAAGALAALGLANMLGLFSRVGGVLSTVGGAFRNFNAEVAGLQIWQNMQAGIGGAEGAAGRFGATMSTLGGRIKTTGSSLLSMFGGPWLLAAAGAGLVINGIIQSFRQHDAEVQLATQDVTDYYKAVAAGGQGSLPALEQLQAKQEQLLSVQKQIAAISPNLAAADDVTATDLAYLKGVASDLSHEIDTGTQKWKDYYNSLGLVDQKTADVNVASAHLQEVMKTHASGSLAVREAVNQLTQAQKDQKQAQDDLNQVTKTAAQLAYDNANAVIAEARAGENSKAAFDDFTTTLGQYRTDTKDATVSAAQLTSEQHRVADSAFNAADGAGRAAEAYAKASGMSDTSAASAYGQLIMLEKVAQAMGTDTPASVRTSIAALQQSVAQGKLTADQMDAIAHAVDGIPDNQKINVTADTSQAVNDINGMISQYRNIQYTGSAILVNGRVVANADGNLLEAFASGGMSPMSSSVAQVVQPGTLRVIGDNPVADEAFIPINNSSRSMKILGETASRMGMGLVAMADGGMTLWGQPWGTGDRFPVGADRGLLSSFRSALDHDASQLGAAKAAAAFTGGGGGGGNPAMRALGQQIAANLGWASQFAAIDYIFSHESGWNPNAQNPTSTAYGIPQFLNGTWAQYGGKTSSPGLQITDGIRYMVDRYGSPNAAAGFWQAHHWYKDGTNYVPSDQLAVLHKGEAVIPADKNQGAPYMGGSGPATFHLYDSSGALLGTMRGIAKAEADTAMGDLHDTMHYAGG